MSHTTPPMPPDYDLEGSGHVTEGQRIFESPKPKLTGVETSTAEWKFVERILPSLSVPEPPKHEKYPTPSGWCPVTGNAKTKLVSMFQDLNVCIYKSLYTVTENESWHLS